MGLDYNTWQNIADYSRKLGFGPCSLHHLGAAAADCRLHFVGMYAGSDKVGHHLSAVACMCMHSSGTQQYCDGASQHRTIQKGQVHKFACYRDDLDIHVVHGRVVAKVHTYSLLRMTWANIPPQGFGSEAILL